MLVHVNVVAGAGGSEEWDGNETEGKGKVGGLSSMTTHERLCGLAITESVQAEEEGHVVYCS